ncbi:MAG: hypothetical protein J2P18_06525 [Nocardia sp.]|nr:hypothetical protein [Nocardia sp.]
MSVTRSKSKAAFTALGIALAAVVVLFAGCGNHKGDKGVPMNTTVTESAARERITAYFLDTLRALPPGVGLSRTPQNPDLSAFKDDAAISVPCDDNNDDPRKPEQAQLAYWVVGVPAGQDSHYFELIRNYWTGRGFRLNPDSDSRWAAVWTQDGYSLSVKNAGKGDGSLSVGAGSPCFPKSAAGTTTPQPTQLRRPS